MEVKKIVEGMTAPQVAQVIDDNFNALNAGKAETKDVNEGFKKIDREIIILRQGGIDTVYGIDNNLGTRVSSVNYVEPETVVSVDGDVWVWGIAYYERFTKEFVKYVNYKLQKVTSEPEYIGKIVFSKTDGNLPIKPEDIYGNTVGYTLGNYLKDLKVNQVTIQVDLERGLLYNLYNSAQADGFPSSLVGRKCINKASKTANYLSAKNYVSIKAKDAQVVLFEYDENGGFVSANYHPTTEQIPVAGCWCKIMAIKGELIRPDLTLGSLSSEGVETNSNTRKRSGYIDFAEFDFVLIENGQKVNIRVFDEDKKFYKQTSREEFPYLFVSGRGIIAKEHILRYYQGAKYVRFIVGDDSDKEYPDVKLNLIKADGICNMLEYSTEGEIQSIKEFGVADKTISISYSTEVSNPRTEDNYHSKILIRLPKCYSNKGRKTPVVLFKTGSGGFNSMSTTEFNYANYVQYLVDMGFAVFDFHAGTSKNPEIDGFGTPTNIYAAMNAYKYVVDHYNVRAELFLACKSLGGNIAMLLAYSSLPVKAVGMLAPAMNPSGWCFGYTEEEQLSYAQDFGFKEGYESVLNGSNDYKRQEFKELVQENLDVLTGYQPMQLGVTNKKFGETFVNQDVYDPDVEDSFKDIIRYVPVPIKFWVAPDDTKTSIQMHRNFVKSAINGGSTAYLRELPEGTGAHHAVDNDPNALQTTNITTRLGVHYETMTTAWVELAEWFMKYGG